MILISLSLMLLESAVIHRLVNSSGSLCAQGGSCTKDTVLLFVRVPGGSYISLGRVACQTCDLTSRPVRVSWKLEDFDALTAGGDRKDHKCSESDAEKFENFKNILTAAQL